MNKEAALIMGAIMAILTLLNITLVPEQYEAIQTLVEFFIIAGGVGIIRQFVYSRNSFFKFMTQAQAGKDVGQDEDIRREQRISRR